MDTFYKHWKKLIVLLLVCLLAVGGFTLAYFSDRLSQKVEISTATFSKDAYSIRRTAPVCPFVAGETVSANLHESNAGTCPLDILITITAKWTSVDSTSKLWGNTNDSDDAVVKVGSTVLDYNSNADGSITFTLPKQTLLAATSDVNRTLSVVLPESLYATGTLSFTFDSITVSQSPFGFSETFDHSALNAAEELDFSVKVGWDVGQTTGQKAMMGYLGSSTNQLLTEVRSGTGEMHDWTASSPAPWSRYQNTVNEILLDNQITTIGDYAFIDFDLLTALDLHEGIQDIGSNAFRNISIPELTVPASVTSIQQSAFADCSELVKITFNQSESAALSLPTAGAATGAFYINPLTLTQILGQNSTAQGYDWITDQRRAAAEVPTLAPKDTWYAGTTEKSSITAISIVDSYTPTGSETESWNAGADTDGDGNLNDDVKCYVNGSTLIIAGNGAGSILANEDSSALFYNFSSVPSISGLHLLNTSNAVTMSGAFNRCSSLTALDLNSWDVGNVEDMSGMFYKCSALECLTVSSWNTSKVKDMYAMFEDCSALTSLEDIYGWNTDSLTELTSTFSMCSSLSSMDLSGWNVANVETMGSTFYGCSGLTSINLDGWVTSKVWSMNYMFYNCSSLTELNVNHFDTSKVEYLSGMFRSCTSLKYLDLSNWNTGSATYMPYMFVDCTALETLNLGNWNATNVTYNIEMFVNCRMLSEITLAEKFRFQVTNSSCVLPTPDSTYIPGADGKWYDTTTLIGYTPTEMTTLTRTGNVTYVAVCPKPDPMLAAEDTWYKGTAARSTITEISLVDSYTATGSETESWDASAAGDGSVMAYLTGTKLTLAGNRSGKIIANPNSRFAFSDSELSDYFSVLATITGMDLLDTSEVTTMRTMFYNCSSLNSLDVSGFDTSKVTDMNSTFYSCKALTSLDVSRWDTSQVTTMFDMFMFCQALNDLDVSKWDTSQVTDMSFMFYSCKALPNPAVADWDVSQVTDMKSMFYDCHAMTTLDCANWVTTQLKDISYMFSDCYGLTTLDCSNWDTSKVTTMCCMFDTCTVLASLNCSNWDTSQVTDMSFMFNQCSVLDGLDVSGWDTSNLTDTRAMFQLCSSLTSLDCSNWDTSRLTLVTSMFDQCSSLTTIYASDLWTTGSITNSTNMFAGCNNLVGAISYDSSKTNATYANYTSGYFTYKAAPAAAALFSMKSFEEEVVTDVLPDSTVPEILEPETDSELPADSVTESPSEASTAEEGSSESVVLEKIPIISEEDSESFGEGEESIGADEITPAA